MTGKGMAVFSFPICATCCDSNLVILLKVNDTYSNKPNRSFCNN
ncbi:uncharacterized protein METZ01_LOCUS383068, partial [marine metagenome]